MKVNADAKASQAQAPSPTPLQTIRKSQAPLAVHRGDLPASDAAQGPAATVEISGSGRQAAARQSQNAESRAKPKPAASTEGANAKKSGPSNQPLGGSAPERSDTRNAGVSRQVSGLNVQSRR